MADKTHRLRYDISATDNATRVFKQVKGGVDELKESYVGLAGAATAAFAAGGMAAFLADAVHYRAALDDLADTTGDNVRTLDALARQARISGLEFDRLEGSLSKFAKNLNSADDEGQAAAQAIQALGLNVDALRAMKPADAMVEIARALGRFEDGAAKVAVATALMGKEGAKNLPFLKDLAEAGELEGRITAEQAAQAERLEKEWRKLKQAFIDGKEALASTLIPVFSDFLEQMREGIRIAGGFGSALMLFGLRTAPVAPGQYGQRIAEYQKEIEEQQAAQQRARETMEGLRRTGAPDSELSGYGAAIAESDRAIATARQKMEFVQFLQRQDALKLAGPGSYDARDLLARQKDTLNFVPTKPGEGKLPSLWTPQDEEMFQARKAAWAESEKIDADFAKADEQRAKDKDQMWSQVFKEIDDEQDREIQRGADFLKDIEDGSKRGADAARELGMTFASAFEDAAVKGEKFGAILQGLEQDVARILFRKAITEPLANGLSNAFANAGFGSLFSGGSSTPAPTGAPRAAGGPVFPGVAYPVGEEGPEIFSPGTPGTIIPNKALGGITITHGDIIIQGAGVTAADVRMAMAASERRTIAAVRELQRR